MSKTLDELYSGKDEPEDKGVSQAEAPAAPATEAQATDKADQQPTAEAGKGEPPSPETVPPGHVPREALTDERRKRQTLEGEIGNLRKEIEALKRGAQPKQEEQRVDPLVDPDGFVAEIEVQRFQDRLALSEDFMRDKVGAEAYSKAEAAVIAVAQQYPQFYEDFAKGVTKAKNPARYTYEVGMEILKRQEEADPAKQRQKFREEIKAEIMRELGLTPQQAEAAMASQGAPAQQQAAPAPRVPTSLAGVQSTLPRSGGVKPIKRKSLSEIYGQ